MFLLPGLRVDVAEKRTLGVQSGRRDFERRKRIRQQRDAQRHCNVRLTVLSCSFSNSFGIQQVISVTADERNDSVTGLRAALLKDAIQNLAEINGCTVGSNGLRLLVSKNKNISSDLTVLCGSVNCSSTAEEYKRWVYKLLLACLLLLWFTTAFFDFRGKQNVIAQMSANRVESVEYPIDIVSKLSRASIVYELLSVRHNKVVNSERNTSNKSS